MPAVLLWLEKTNRTELFWIFVWKSLQRNVVINTSGCALNNTLVFIFEREPCSASKRTRLQMQLPRARHTDDSSRPWTKTVARRRMGIAHVDNRSIIGTFASSSSIVTSVDVLSVVGVVRPCFLVIRCLPFACQLFLFLCWQRILNNVKKEKKKKKRRKSFYRLTCLALTTVEISEFRWKLADSQPRIDYAKSVDAAWILHMRATHSQWRRVTKHGVLGTLISRDHLWRLSFFFFFLSERAKSTIT